MRRRYFLVLIVSVGLLLSGETGARAADWTKHTYATDGFEIEFSGDVAATPTELDAETKKKMARSTNYQQDSPETVYAVGASLLLVDVNLDNGATLSYAQFKCNTKTDDFAVPFAGGRGRELRGTDCVDGNYAARARYLTIGRWFYQVIALYKKTPDENQGVKHFVESFKYIGPK